VHRDVKPANIMIDGDGTAVVADFGIAKRSGEINLTQSGATVGTPRYMSPEQFAGTAVTSASDQYSLGIVAYEMFAGRLPYDADTYVGLMRAHVDEPPIPLRHVAPNVPADVEAIIMRMLHKQPAARWTDLDACAALLASAVGGDDHQTRSTLRRLAMTGSTSRPRISVPESPAPRGASADAAARRRLEAARREVERLEAEVEQARLAQEAATARERLEVARRETARLVQEEAAARAEAERVAAAIREAEALRRAREAEEAQAAQRRAALAEEAERAAAERLAAEREALERIARDRRALQQAAADEAQRAAEEAQKLEQLRMAAERLQREQEAEAARIDAVQRAAEAERAKVAALVPVSVPEPVPAPVPAPPPATISTARSARTAAPAGAQRPVRTAVATAHQIQRPSAPTPPPRRVSVAEAATIIGVTVLAAAAWVSTSVGLFRLAPPLVPTDTTTTVIEDRRPVPTLEGGGYVTAAIKDSIRAEVALLRSVAGRRAIVSLRLSNLSVVPRTVDIAINMRCRDAGSVARRSVPIAPRTAIGSGMSGLYWTPCMGSEDPRYAVSVSSRPPEMQRRSEGGFVWAGRQQDVSFYTKFAQVGKASEAQLLVRAVNDGPDTRTIQVTPRIRCDERELEPQAARQAEIPGFTMINSRAEGLRWMACPRGTTVASATLSVQTVSP
jgi:hypothetical protein